MRSLRWRAVRGFAAVLLVWLTLSLCPAVALAEGARGPARSPCAVDLAVPVAVAGVAGVAGAVACRRRRKRATTRTTPGGGGARERRRGR